VARDTLFSNPFYSRRVASPNYSQRLRSRCERSRRGRTLRFESLEDRRVLATFTVTNLNDATVNGSGNAPGTLRQAIYDANISSDADIINFTPGLFGHLRLSIADDSAIGLSALLVTSPITIQGNAAGITIERDITAPEMRLFRIAIGGDLSLDSINLTSGITRGANGASGQDGGIAYAGAIYNQGNLQIISSTLYNNAAIGGNAGAGAHSGTAQGGAVFNDGGNVTIRNATLSGNSVSNGFGFVFNGSYGGSVYSKNGLLTIDNSTITNNSAGSGRDLYIIGIGAGQTATAQIHSSIIAQSDVQAFAYDLNATDDLGGQVVVTGSNNIIRSQNAFQSIRVSFDDPMLGALTTNGGPTRTHALLQGSPAIGHGSNLLGLVNDQRGDTFARVVGGTIDIGAFELQTVATPELLGDYNGNHSVDAADYVIWRKTKGADVPQYAGADGNGSSKVDDADFDVWRAHFGAPSSGSGTAATPQASLIPNEAPPDATRSQRNDSALVATFVSLVDLPFVRIGVRSHSPSSKDQMSLPVSRQARDAALSAIAAESLGRPVSNGKPQSLNGRCDLHAAEIRSDGIALQLDDALRTNEPIVSFLSR
jgi:hypothetical protein